MKKSLIFEIEPQKKDVIKKMKDSGVNEIILNCLEKIDFKDITNKDVIKKMYKGVPKGKFYAKISNMIADWIFMGNFRKNSPCTRSYIEEGNLEFENDHSYARCIPYYIAEPDTFLYQEFEDDIDFVENIQYFGSNKNTKITRAIITKVEDGYIIHRIYINTSATQKKEVLKRICEMLECNNKFKFERLSYTNDFAGYIDIFNYSDTQYYFVSKTDENGKYKDAQKNIEEFKTKYENIFKLFDNCIELKSTTKILEQMCITKNDWDKEFTLGFLESKKTEEEKKA